MLASASYPQFASAWSDFLIACGGVYSKLEQGSKGCGVSEGWFGRKRHDRKTDALLRYLHHARNSDEHGIEPTTAAKQKMLVGGNGYIRSLTANLRDDGQYDVKFEGDASIDIEVKIFAILVAAVDTRHGDVFPPPTQHLGDEIDPLPARVARLGLTYLERLIAETAQLPQRS
jgi:hypothetical protein